MTTKGATKVFDNKVAVALFVVALTILTQGIVSRVGQSDEVQGLPNPADIRLLSSGRKAADEVVAVWESRVAASPASSAYRVKLASSMLSLAGRTGDLALYEEAEVVARVAVDLDPKSEPAQLVLASALAGQHGFSASLDLANQVLQKSPTSVAARITAGDSRLELGDYSGVTKIYAQLARELPAVPAILSREARLAALTGDISSAVELSRDALVESGKDDLGSYEAAFYWFQLANYQYQSGQYEEAEKMLRSALVLEPLHLGSKELLGKVLVARGRYDEATTLYEDLVLRTPAADLHGELGKLYAQAGRTQDAAKQVELGLTIAKKQANRFPAERRHLIGFLADHNPAEALRLARADLAARGDIYTNGWLAWALLQAGHPEEAATYLPAALALGTQDAWLLYQAGSIYAAVGDTAKARTMLTSALDLSSEFDLDHAQRARDLLAGLGA